MDVTTWYLELTGPDELRPGRRPAQDVEIVRAEVPSPEFSRFLYTAVGGDWRWTDRLPWTWRQWKDWLDRPGVETWVAWLRGTPAGYVELAPGGRAEGDVEIAYFGLLPYAIGQGIGGHLLTAGVTRAWDLADRWPGLPPTKRVWLHTCSLDGPTALANYQARGFRIYDVKVEPANIEGDTPGPWPGAGSR